MSNFQLHAAVNTDDDHSEIVLLGSLIECSNDHTHCQSTKLIRAHSHVLESYSVVSQRSLSRYRISDLGDHDENLINCLEWAIQQQKKCVIFGGSHASTIALLPVLSTIETFIIFDAHSDFYQTYNKTSDSHACVVRQIINQTNARCIMLGIRDISEEHFSELLQNERILLIPEKDLFTKSSSELYAKLDVFLQQRSIFISIDLDVLDPAFVPAVSTPVPGGWSYTDLVEGLRLILTRETKLVGCDIQELSTASSYSNSQLNQSALVVCSLIRDMICMLHPSE